MTKREREKTQKTDCERYSWAWTMWLVTDRSKWDSKSKAPRKQHDNTSICFLSFKHSFVFLDASERIGAQRNQLIIQGENIISSQISKNLQEYFSQPSLIYPKGLKPSSSAGHGTSLRCTAWVVHRLASSQNQTPKWSFLLLPCSLRPCNKPRGFTHWEFPTLAESERNGTSIGHDCTVHMVTNKLNW